jgi:hypothetical protein
MLTDEELTRRLSAAFHEGVPELTYAGTAPQVRRRGTGLAATSVLAAAAALVLTPAALQRGADRPPSSVPSADPGVHDTGPQGHTVIRTVDLGGLHLTYAQMDAMGPLYFTVGPDLSLPPDAEKADIDAAGNADVWFVDNPPSGEPQAYVKPKDSSMLYGLLAPGWTREQLIDLFEHPVAVQQGSSD